MRRSELSAGTNLRDDRAWADWRFLLPDPEPRRVLFLGNPRPSRLVAFSDVADEVLVAAADRAAAEELRRTARQRDLPDVRVVATQARWEALPLGDGSISLVMAGAGRPVRALERSAGLAAEVCRVLAPGGAVCLETKGWRAGGGGRAVARLADRGFAGPRRYRLVPPTGPTRAVLPSGDPEIARRFFQGIVQGRSLRKRALIRVGAWLARAGLLRFVLRRGLVVLWLPGEEARTEGGTPNRLPGTGPESEATAVASADGAPPAYLATVLEEHGLEPRRFRAGLSLHGAYNSSKITWVLFPRGQDTPVAVAKLPRDPRYNHRLENEGRALSLLAEGRYLPAGAYPERLFMARAGGLAALGQRFVDGVPFRRGTAGHPGCLRAREAVDSLIRLGEASAAPGGGFVRDHADALAALHERFVETYRPAPAEERFLRECLTTLTEREDEVPAVMQHGDPGVWNVLLPPGGGVTFLDWEAAEHRGIPLWDLFYFLRSFGTWIQWLGGERSLRETYERCFLEDGEFAAVQADAVARYCRRVGVPRDAVEPLFYLCWVHRAVKEAARLPSDELERGKFRRLLRLCVERRDAAGLQLLFGNGDGTAGPGERRRS